MTGKTYIDHVKPYRPLVDMHALDEEIARAEEIVHRLWHGCPEDGLEPNEVVIHQALTLTDPNGQMGHRTMVYAVGALLSSASFIVAEQERVRGKLFTDEQLGEMMLEVLPQMAQSKHQLQQHARAEETRVRTKER